MQHVAVGDDIFLAFEPEFARLASARLAVAGDIIVIGDGLGADKTFFEIAMDDARRRRRLRAGLNGPSASFLRADSEIGDQVQQAVAGADDAVEARLVETDGFEIILLLGGGHDRDLALDLRRDDYRDLA